MWSSTVPLFYLLDYLCQTIHNIDNASFLKMIVISSSSSYICHGVGPLVDPFRSHVSGSLFKDLP